MRMTQSEMARRKYYKLVRRSFPSFGQEQKKVLRLVDQMLGECANETPNLSYEQMVERFGKPEKIADTYIEQKNSEEIISALRVRKRVLTVIISGVIVIIMIWLGYLVFCLHEVNKVANGYFVVDGPIVIEPVEIPNEIENTGVVK